MRTTRPVVGGVGTSKWIPRRRLKGGSVRVRSEGSLLANWGPGRSRVEDRDPTIRPHRSTDGQPGRARPHESREGLRIPILYRLVAQYSVSGVRVAIPSKLQHRRQLPAGNLGEPSLAAVDRGRATSGEPVMSSQAGERRGDCEGNRAPFGHARSTRAATGTGISNQHAARTSFIGGSPHEPQGVLALLPPEKAERENQQKCERSHAS